MKDAVRDEIEDTLKSGDWPRVKVGDVADLINGDRGANYPSKEDLVDQGVPFINAGHIADHELMLDELDFITPKRFQKLRSGKVQPNDLLFCLRGSLGKSAIVRNIEKGAIASSLVILRPSGEILSKFLFFLLTSPYGRALIREYDNGTAQPNLAASSLAGFEIPLPPLPVQRRITAKLDTLTSHASHANDYLTAIPPLIDKFRQSVLARAFTGELTADWRKQHPDVEPASELLERIKVERREKWIGNYARKLADRARKRNEKKGKTFTQEDWQAYFDKKVKVGAKKYEEPEPIDAEEEGLPEIPETWEWVRLGMLGRLETGSTPSKSDDSNYGDYLPFIKPTELDGGRVGVHSREKLSTQGARKARVLPPQSILVTCIGATIGKTGLATTECATNQQINAVVPFKAMVDPEWLYFVMKSPQLQFQIKRDASATTLPILNKTKFGELAIALPPVAEQTYLGKVIESQMSVSRRTQTTINTVEKRQEQLKSSLLADALQG